MKIRKQRSRDNSQPQNRSKVMAPQAKRQISILLPWKSSSSRRQPKWATSTPTSKTSSRIVVFLRMIWVSWLQVYKTSIGTRMHSSRVIQTRSTQARLITNMLTHRTCMASNCKWWINTKLLHRVSQSDFETRLVIQPVHIISDTGCSTGE